MNVTLYGRPTTTATLIAFCLALAAPVFSGESRSERTARLRAELRAAEQAVVDDRQAEAEVAYRRIVEEMDATGSRTLLLARAIDGLADVLRGRERTAEAEPLYRRSIELWETLLGADQPRLAT